MRGHHGKRGRKKGDTNDFIDRFPYNSIIAFLKRKENINNPVPVHRMVWFFRNTQKDRFRFIGWFKKQKFPPLIERQDNETEEDYSKKVNFKLMQIFEELHQMILKNANDKEKGRLYLLTPKSLGSRIKFLLKRNVIFRRKGGYLYKKEYINNENTRKENITLLKSNKPFLYKSREESIFSVYDKFKLDKKKKKEIMVHAKAIKRLMQRKIKNFKGGLTLIIYDSTTKERGIFIPY